MYEYTPCDESPEYPTFGSRYECYVADCTASLDPACLPSGGDLLDPWGGQTTGRALTCVSHDYDDFTAMEFSACFGDIRAENPDDPPPIDDIIYLCAERSGLDVEALRGCTEGPTSRAYARSDMERMLNPRYHWRFSPQIYINYQLCSFGEAGPGSICDCGERTCSTDEIPRLLCEEYAAGGGTLPPDCLELLASGANTTGYVGGAQDAVCELPTAQQRTVRVPNKNDEKAPPPSTDAPSDLGGALPEDPELACSGAKAVAAAIQGKYGRLYRKALPAIAADAELRAKTARKSMTSACKTSWQQWAIIGKDPEDDSSTRKFADFQDSMGGGSVSIETMGPDVTGQLRSLCDAIAITHGDAIAEGYAAVEAAAEFKLTERLKELVGVCPQKKKKKKAKKKKKGKKGKKGEL